MIPYGIRCYRCGAWIKNVFADKPPRVHLAHDHLADCVEALQDRIIILEQMLPPQPKDGE